MAKKEKHPKEKHYPKEPDWRCIYCQQMVTGGTTHKCTK